MQTIPADIARRFIINGQSPEDLHVTGNLDLSNEKIRWLPDGLEVDNLDVSGCTELRELPAGLKVKRLTLNGCTSLLKLPATLSCYELEMRNLPVRTLPKDLRVEYRLDLEGCSQLERLPEGFKVGTLILRDCVSLTALPEDLEVYFLDISGCTNLAKWPKAAKLQFGRLVARDCISLTYLPDWLNSLSQLDLRGCVSFAELPAGLRVGSWLDLGGTQVKSLPQSLVGVQLNWRGITVDERVAFQPETITSQEVLAERNAEKRRVLLERMGYERFMEEAQAELLDQDRDPGGKRQLLRVPLPNDEPLVCVAVRCPSTARQYVLRVPPTVSTCHQAAAWLAGFDDTADYHPVMET